MEYENLLDAELDAIMKGRRCVHETVEIPSGRKQVSRDEPVDATWVPVKPAPGEMDKLKAGAKYICAFAGMSLLFFIWRELGLLDPAAATPAILVCVGGTGVTAIASLRR